MISVSRPYAGAIAAGGGSPIAAAARAAHTVLFTKFPSLQSNIDTCYTASMAGVVLTPADLTASDAVGNAAAENVLFSRDGDGSFPSPASPFAGGLGPGQWRPNPTTESMAAPWGGDVRPFAIESVQRCQPDDPPLMTSAEYAEAYNEVKSLGSATNSARTPGQSRMARIYSGGIPGQFNRLVRDLAAAYLAGNTTANLGDRARLYALVNTAIADAFICTWNSKKKFGFWRPVHAIQNGDQDGNLLTEKDADLDTVTSFQLRLTTPTTHPERTASLAPACACSRCSSVVTGHLSRLRSMQRPPPPACNRRRATAPSFTSGFRTL